MPRSLARPILRFLALAACARDGSADLDRDGIPDRLEQQLLERFLPRFLISVRECDALPAQFQPGSEKPALVAKDGTIYGRVSPAATSGAIEVQFYHLWWRDCGRRGHQFDVEHVSVLLRPAGADDWVAAYWYASAHQDTVCDAGNAARAAVLGAEQRGAQVWISRGKHASFLSADLCKGGCGGDKCGEMKPFTPPRVINFGEPGASLNGAVWGNSPELPLALKLKSDFSPGIVAQLEDDLPRKVASANGSKRTTQAFILASSSTADALETGNRRTGRALAKADASTTNALGRSKDKAGRSLGRAARAVRRFLGAGGAKQK
jgi:hypothetical protein